jgi:hypothetical protein
VVATVGHIYNRNLVERLAARDPDNITGIRRNCWSSENIIMVVACHRLSYEPFLVVVVSAADNVLNNNIKDTTVLGLCCVCEYMLTSTCMSNLVVWISKPSIHWSPPMA